MQRLSSPSLVCNAAPLCKIQIYAMALRACWGLMSAVTKASRLKLWGFLKRRRRERRSQWKLAAECFTSGSMRKPREFAAYGAADL